MKFAIYNKIDDKSNEIQVKDPISFAKEECDIVLSP